MNTPDRVEELLKRPDLTGIDFIFVHPDQTTLDIYFLWNPAKHEPPQNPVPLMPLTGALTPADVRIYSPLNTAPDISVGLVSWVDLEGMSVLRLNTLQPGDFTQYKLRIDDLRLDPFYNDIPFSFKANCPSDLDCAPSAPECPPETPVDFPVDYQARDFDSFRQALLEFAGQRNPDWPDRLEADAGVMLAEVMSALGDEMAYYQDKIAREAYLETATQRRSLRFHSRLVDYPLHDGLGATTWLNITASAENIVIAAGSPVSANGDNGVRQDFSVGKNISEILSASPYSVSESLNQFLPHLWDEDQVCLPVGATVLDIEKKPGVSIEFDDQIEGKPGQIPGKWVLLQTNPTNPAQPIRTHFVRVIDIQDMTDPVFNKTLTRLTWEDEQTLPFEMDLTTLRVYTNIIPATAGTLYGVYFIVGGDFSELPAPAGEILREMNHFQAIPRAVERQGHDGSVTYLFTLPDSDQSPLVWLGNSPDKARPEVVLEEWSFEEGNWVPAATSWEWKPSFLGVNSSQPEDTHFTLDDGTWRRVVGYQRAGGEFVHYDYASGKGITLRFGDGEFGQIPTEKTVFRVYYRLGGGRQSNVAANTLQKHALPDIERVTNPLPAVNGRDAETPDELRQLAPDAFRAISYRAVRPEDYAEAAERLPWVQRAGATFRWTGSWLSAFVTPDPRNAFRLDDIHRKDLVRQLDRFRQAGREAHVLNPLYADIDLEIEICAEPSAYRGEVKARVLEVLLGKKGVRYIKGYFSPDRFTFGTSLERSSLEAVIQATPGVRAVEKIRFRRRGWFDWRTFEELSYSPGVNTILRVENDPLKPGNGTVKLYIHGGA